MQLYTIIHAEPHLGNVDRVVAALIDELKLVPARSTELCPNETRSERELLVYEDPKSKIGIYRVHLFENEYLNSQNENLDSFSFTYWSQRLTEEIVREDPMRKAIEKTKEVISGRVIEDIRTNLPKERILQIMRQRR